MRINPDALKEGLKEILAMDGTPKDYIGARWIIRGALSNTSASSKETSDVPASPNTTTQKKARTNDHRPPRPTREPAPHERTRSHHARLYEAEADISRAAEYLYRIILEKATYTSGGPFGNAVLNLGQALRNRHNMDGGGR